MAHVLAKNNTRPATERLLELTPLPLLLCVSAVYFGCSLTADAGGAEGCTD